MQPGPNTSMFIQYCSKQQGSLIDAELKPQYKTDMDEVHTTLIPESSQDQSHFVMLQNK